MIGFLRGRLLSQQGSQLLIDVQGVGYEVDAPTSTLAALAGDGEEVMLFTHLVVREDAHTLFGFATERERGLFRSLIKVNGVGAKLALTILSGMSADTFARCVFCEDTTALTKIPGIGKKTAERLVVEMRDRLESSDMKADKGSLTPAMATGDMPTDAVSDAVSALIALGYTPPDASKMVRAVKTDELPSDEIIRQALQAAAR